MIVNTNAKYRVDKKLFEKDCFNLASLIKKNPIEGARFINTYPSNIIAINEDGLLVARELRKTLSFVNKICMIKINPKTQIIDKPFTELNLEAAFLVTAIQNTGKTLFTAINHLKTLYETKDLDLILVALYDRLNRTSTTYIPPSFHGIAFINHNWIEMPEWKS